jgi:hypothetical protein
MTEAERRGAAAFKARLLSAIDNIITSELPDEEGSGYVLGPAFKPDTETNMLAMRAWIESFRI